MYQASSLAALFRWRGRGQRAPWVGHNVLFLGLTSLITDISSEMVAAALPIYLVYTLELSPLSLGVIDGLYHAAAVLVRVATGLVADRWRRLKEVAGLGYALSAVCKLGLLAAGGAAPALAAVVVLDRAGKGVRTAPRDALLSLSAPAEAMATAFGVHRALDTIGATLGPLAAFALLSVAPGRFDAIFVVSFCIAAVGVALFVLLVEPRAAAERPARRATPIDALRLLRRPGFAPLIAVGSLLSAVTLSDGLLYLVLQRRVGFAAGYLPLLYVGSALAYAMLAVPMGRLADGLGRRRVFVFGYLLLAALYATVLLGPRSWGTVVACMGLLGATYAATDGVLMALASPLLPEALRTTGLAVLTTFTSVARLLASVVFGAVWTFWGAERALVVFLGAVTVASIGAATLWGARPHQARDDG
jgi:MFS family permease